MPFSVRTWSTRGPLMVFMVLRVFTMPGKSWPSMGPKYRKPSSSNSMPGDQRFLTLSSTFLAKSTMRLPPTNFDARLMICLTIPRIFTVMGDASMEPKYLLMAPTLGAMDMPLSFTTRMMSRSECPALFMPSYGMPHVSAPSPATATTWNVSPLTSRAAAIPRAADMAVPA